MILQYRKKYRMEEDDEDEEEEGITLALGYRSQYSD
jgi:hypothetical protein